MSDQIDIAGSALGCVWLGARELVTTLRFRDYFVSGERCHEVLSLHLTGLPWVLRQRDRYLLAIDLGRCLDDLADTVSVPPVLDDMTDDIPAIRGASELDAGCAGALTLLGGSQVPMPYPDGARRRGIDDLVDKPFPLEQATFTRCRPLLVLTGP